MKNFADLEYTNFQEFVEMYKDKDALKDESPGELGFPASSNGFDAASSKRAAVRLSVAWGTAKAINDSRVAALTAHGNDQVKTLTTIPVRSNMETLWDIDHNQVKPSLEEQGSDTLIGLLIKKLSAESVPVLEEKHLVCKLDEDLGHTVKTKRGKGGAFWVVDEEKAIPSAKLDELKSI